MPPQQLVLGDDGAFSIPIDGVQVAAFEANRINIHRGTVHQIP